MLRQNFIIFVFISILFCSDKMFPAFGFGMRVPPDWKISHEFPLVSDNSKFSFKINSLVIL